ncbi:uncharacterized protein LOC125504558 [Dendroctonus ponderosae]|uniref:uncharacterized protein LOC125504558 n=1 Tax=Dendroctonus ponderosae TaxID=77166 RepID=UPI002034ECA3|nr:uncharacterized protein LOC125504558 [Dendroctonus ponderosae]
MHMALIDYLPEAIRLDRNLGVVRAINGTCVYYKYTNLLWYIYGHATLQVKTNDDWTTGKIPVRRGVIQGDTISPKLITLALEDIFKYSSLSWEHKRISIDGRRLIHLQFVDDIIIFSSDPNKLVTMIQEFKD